MNEASVEASDAAAPGLRKQRPVEGGAVKVESRTLMPDDIGLEEGLGGTPVAQNAGTFD